MASDKTILATADRLYFNGGYRTINRGMLERILREAEAELREMQDAADGRKRRSTSTSSGGE